MAGALLALVLGATIAHADVLVAVTDVTATTARLWLHAPAGVPVPLVLEPAAEAAPAAVHPGPDGRVISLLHRLQPGRRYHYRLGAGTTAASGAFVTAPAPDAAAPVSLAWSADLGARRHCPEPTSWEVLDRIAARRPDLLVLAGDTIYADHWCGGFVARTAADFAAKHHANRAQPAVQRLLRTTSVSATWDDHEVRNNFAGTVEPLAPIGLRAFLDYWPVAAPAGRLYRSLRWGRLLELFLLDTRQYRDANGERDGAGKTMLGEAQRRWLIDAVASSTATWKVVVSSVPLSIPKGWPFGDSWARRSVLGYRTGFAVERDAILRALLARGVRQLVVLAGDVHFGAFMTHRPLRGLEVHELIAGPLAARLQEPRPPAEGLGTRVHVAHGGTPTFGELRVTVDALVARLLDDHGRVLGEFRADPR